MSNNKEKQTERPRGRPKRSDIAHLIVQGMKSQSGIKCKICARVFPRQKSLQAHILTHNDVKKYKCHFPRCIKSFKQSSQLQSHLYLHSKEKPFKCPADGCMIRFAHTHRICPSHPDLKLIKTLETAEEIRLRFYQDMENLPEDDIKWFEEYLNERERKLRQRNALAKRMKNVEDLHEIEEDRKKKSHQAENTLTRHMSKYVFKKLEDCLIFMHFLSEIHKNVEHPKALPE